MFNTLLVSGSFSGVAWVCLMHLQHSGWFMCSELNPCLLALTLVSAALLTVNDFRIRFLRTQHLGQLSSCSPICTYYPSLLSLVSSNTGSRYSLPHTHTRTLSHADDLTLYLHSLHPTHSEDSIELACLLIFAVVVFGGMACGVALLEDAR